MTKLKLSLLSLSTTLFLASEKALAACDPNTQGCISTPEGILAQSDKTKGIADFFNWILLSAALIGCIVFGVKAAKKLNDEDFTGAIGPFLGSMLSGIISFVAYTVVS